MRKSKNSHFRVDFFLYLTIGYEILVNVITIILVGRRRYILHPTLAPRKKKCEDHHQGNKLESQQQPEVSFHGISAHCLRDCLHLSYFLRSLRLKMLKIEQPREVMIFQEHFCLAQSHLKFPKLGRATEMSRPLSICDQPSL